MMDELHRGWIRPCSAEEEDLRGEDEGDSVSRASLCLSIARHGCIFLAFSKSAVGVEFCFVMQKLKIVTLNSALKLFNLLLSPLLGQDEPSYGDVPVFIDDALPLFSLRLSLVSDLCCYSTDPKAQRCTGTQGSTGFGWGCKPGICSLPPREPVLRLQADTVPLSPLGMERSRMRTPSRPPRFIWICGSTSLCRTGCWTLGGPSRW